MRLLWIAALCFVLGAPCLAQTADTDPATKDDIILYLQTMHTNDLIQRLMEVQSKGMQQIVHDQLAEGKGGVSADFDTRLKKAMDDLINNIPIDEITEAMIPAYQKHFTHGDIIAMNAFYSSPIGQKALQELPEVSQEGMQAAMPILKKYLTDWQSRMQELKQQKNPTPSEKSAPAQN